MSIDRIEKALTRIEAQATLSQHSPSDDALLQKHQILREQVSTSLAELNTLIKGIEG